MVGGSISRIVSVWGNGGVYRVCTNRTVVSSSSAFRPLNNRILKKHFQYCTGERAGKGRRALGRIVASAL